jgi:hypothetical protein
MDVSFYVDVSVGSGYVFSGSDLSTYLEFDTWISNGFTLQTPSWLTLPILAGSGDYKQVITCDSLNYDAEGDVSILTNKSGNYNVHYYYIYNDIPDYGDLEAYWTFDNTLMDVEGNLMESSLAYSFETGVKNQCAKVIASGNGSSTMFYDFDKSFSFDRNWSIIFWVKINKNSSPSDIPKLILSGPKIFDIVPSWEAEILPMEINPTTDMDFEFYKDFVASEGIPINGVYYDQWYHFAFVYDLSQKRINLYQDASLMGTKDVSTYTSGGDTLHFFRGRDHIFYIDELYVYNKAIDASTVLTLYNRI